MVFAKEAFDVVQRLSAPFLTTPSRASRQRRGRQLGDAIVVQRDRLDRGPRRSRGRRARTPRAARAAAAIRSKYAFENGLIFGRLHVGAVANVRPAPSRSVNVRPSTRRVDAARRRTRLPAPRRRAIESITATELPIAAPTPLWPPRTRRRASCAGSAPERIAGTRAAAPRTRSQPQAAARARDTT